MASKRISKDHIDKFYDYDLDMDNRTIYMGSVSHDEYFGSESGTDYQMAERLIKAIHILDAGAPSGDKPITIIMNNLGGDWYHGMAIYDAIRACKSPVTIRAFGHAMSMGSIILQAADKRVLSENSRFMIHYGTEGYSGHSKNMAKWATEGQRVNHTMENIYLDGMEDRDEEMYETDPQYMEKLLTRVLNRQNEGSIPPRKSVKVKLAPRPSLQRREDMRHYLEQLLNYDTILTPEETVALGLADEVLK